MSWNLLVLMSAKSTRAWWLAPAVLMTKAASVFVVGTRERACVWNAAVVSLRIRALLKVVVVALE
jgi:hypothetical protein